MNYNLKLLSFIIILFLVNLFIFKKNRLDKKKHNSLHAEGNTYNNHLYLMSQNPT